MTTQHVHTHVDVLLTTSARQDVDAVYDALATAFPATAGREPAQDSSATAGGAPGHPKVWAIDVDAMTRAAAESRPSPLAGAVSVGISGCPVFVHQVRDVLEDVFEAEELGHVSGDQEEEVRLRLTPRAQ
ncbi:MAG: hypothetical protein QOI83_1879 [Streptomycetaceae bacterium]|nr:hypothetical protein [Streptomycetaceae bacterium]